MALNVGLLKPPVVTLSERLHQHVVTYEAARPMVRLHASDVTQDNPQFCPRERAFHLRDQTVLKPKKVTTSQRLTWEIGNLVAAQVVDWFAEMGLAVGRWKCASCGQIEGPSKRPKSCKCGGGRSWEYVEYRVLSKITGISCGIDLLIDLGNKKLEIVELKTIDKEKFKELKAPLAEHRARTCLYMKCAQESDDPFCKQMVTTKSRILYVSKGGWGVQNSKVSDYGTGESYSPFQEFFISQDLDLIEPYRLRGMEVEAYKQTGVLPCRICTSPYSPRAKGCSKILSCFQED